MTMTPHLFIARWKRSNLSEISAYQQHFLDLCDVLGEKKPADVDPDGTWYTFQKGLTTTEDAKGWADVWLRKCFGWEYKGKHKDLKAAYQQLLKYREALENPPLLIVCDLDRFEIHTNFTGTAKQVHALKLDDLTDPKKLQLLRDAFKNPEALKPGKTQKQVTEEVAETFAKIADGSAHDPWQRYVQDIDAKTGIGTVRYPRVVAKHPDYARKLRERTLTNLYNERPAWLASAHRALDEAVFAAYGWPANLSDEELLAKLLERPTRRERRAYDRFAKSPLKRAQNRA